MVGLASPRQTLLDLKQIAEERYPDAEEVYVLSDNMKPVYSLDINIVLGEDAISNVFEIMYDEDTNTYMLYGYDREEGIPEAGEEDQVTSYMNSFLLEDFEVIMKRTPTIMDVVTRWGILDSHLSKAARERIKELGGDPDEVVAAVDKAALENPNLFS